MLNHVPLSNANTNQRLEFISSAFYYSVLSTKSTANGILSRMET